MVTGGAAQPGDLGGSTSLRNSPDSEADQHRSIANLQAHRLARQPWEWRKQVLAGPFTIGVKLAAIAIAEFVNRQSAVAWPTWATVGASCGLSERQIRNAFAETKAAGFFVVRRRRFQGPNEVELALPATDVTGMAVPVTAERKAARRRLSKRHPDVEVTGTPVPLEPSIEPSTEPSRAIEDVDCGPLVRRASNYEGAKAVVGGAAAALLGYSRSDRPDGEFADTWILSRIPEETLTELRTRCVAGSLTEAALLTTLRQLDIAPRAERDAPASTNHEHDGNG